MNAFFRTAGKALSITGLAALLAAGAASPAQAGDVVVAMTAADIPDWTGQPDQGMEGYRFVGYSLYESLIGWDLSSADAEVTYKPALATEWHVDPQDNTRWIFSLRQGVSFHDGCAWNADTAVWNFQRLLDDHHPAFNPGQFARARARLAEVAKVEKLDDYTIAFTTKSVSSLFPNNIPYVLMISKCAVEAAGNDYAAVAKAPAGTGPYVFESAVPHERLVLARNTKYWDEKRIPKHDRLILVPMPEATTRAAALMSGQVNFIEAPSPDMIPALKDAGMNVITNVYPHVWPYFLNFLNGPFTDKRVRQAANYAINRDEVVALLNGIATPSYGAYIPTQGNYGHVVEYPYDPERARALLQEAGCYPCKINVAISTSGSGQMQPLPMNELLKSQLDAAGFEVNLDVMDWNTLAGVWFKGAVATPQYDALNLSNSIMEPFSFVRQFAKRFQAPNGSNWGGYDNAEVNTLLDEVLSTFDVAKQNDLLRRAHEIATEDASRLFVVSDINPRAPAPSLSGFVQAQSWFQDLTPIVVK